MLVKHAFTHPQPDEAGTGFVKPGNWNEPHVLSLDAGQRVVGRDTGAGLVEEVTASQIFDWVSNTDGALLTRRGGTWAPVAHVSTDGRNLVLDAAEPDAPSPGKLTVYGSGSAGRSMLGLRGAAGSPMLAQPFLGRSHIGGWWPSGLGGTATTNPGVGTPTVVGTATGRAPTPTNSFTAARRLGVVSAATAGSIAGLRTTVAYLCRQFGLHVVYRFGISDAVVSTTGRMFVGLAASTAAPADVEPSTLVNLVGVGVEANDTALRVYAAGTSAQAGVPLGENFPANTTNVDAYELALDCPPGGNISYQVTRLNTGHVAFGLASNQPGSTTFLANQMWRSNGTTAAACAFDLVMMYLDTEI